MLKNRNRFSQKSFLTKLLWGCFFVIFFLSAGYGLMEVMDSRSFQLFGEIINRVETEEKVVALTFDDGPTDNTAEILDILDAAGIKATFFLTGREMEGLPAETKRIVEAGHEIGNHSYSHKRMIFKPPGFIKDEVNRTDKFIRAAGYLGDISFRPPYGKKLFFLPGFLARNDRKTIMWNIEPDSYPEVASDSQAIIEHVKEKIEPGSIILLHVMYDQNVTSRNAIAGIVETLEAKDYSFVTVSELLAHSEED